VKILQVKQHAVTDFNATKVVILMEDKKRAGRAKLVEDAGLEALLDEDPYRTQEKESLRVVQSTIFMRLKALRMIQKHEN